MNVFEVKKSWRTGFFVSSFFCYVIFLTSLLCLSFSYAQSQGDSMNGYVEVGVARIDITPDGPIRLAGYANRDKTETDKRIHRLDAKALAFGSDEQQPSILITLDLVGIPAEITGYLAESLSKSVGISESRLAICASHTHGGPEIGNLLNILQARGEVFSDSLLALDHLVHISEYREELKKKLEEVSLQALKNRAPAKISWGQGEVGFAKNRRTEGGPVDHAMPMLRVDSKDGKLLAVLVNYACHGTTISSVNEIHGDWISEAQKFIESRHPGTAAMVAIGCAGDSNPHPRRETKFMLQHGKAIADEVDQLLKATLEPITAPPTAQMKRVNLPFAHVPSVPELIMESRENTIKGYYSRLALDRVTRGGEIPSSQSYPIQVWTFGNKMAMINLPGEVVVDYSLRLKREIGSKVLWINSYTNDVPSYIASKRVIAEGGYEAEGSMYWYDKPSPYKPEIEDIIIEAVHDLLPGRFKKGVK
jgi:hypothetical protein